MDEHAYHICDCKQGTEAWFEFKRGVPSASNFERLVQLDGKPSQSAKTYINSLIAERITGEVVSGYQSAAMADGNAREAAARTAYSFISGFDVEQVGFLLEPDCNYGCSPDAIFRGQKRGVEIKAPLASTLVGYLKNPRTAINKYYQQVQGSMLVTGFDKWDLFIYHEKMPVFLQPIVRDEIFLKSLKHELAKATRSINETVAQLSTAA